MRGRSFFNFAGLFGVALLRDMFSSVNNRVNGFEHVLRRRKGRRYPNHGTTYFPPAKRNGAQECARRVRQLQRRGVFHGVHLKTGAGALLQIQPAGVSEAGVDPSFRNPKRWVEQVRVKAQFDDQKHPHAYGWTQYAGSEFAVGYGRK